MYRRRSHSLARPARSPAWWTLIPILILSVVSCSDDPPRIAPPVDEIDAEDAAEVADIQHRAFRRYAGLTFAWGHEAAADSVHDLLESEPKVAWAAVDRQGIAITYDDGFRGGIFLDPDDGEPLGYAPSGRAARGSAGAPIVGGSARLHVPNHAARGDFFRSLLDSLPGAFEAGGHDAPRVLLDEDCTLDALLDLEGVDVWHLISHGWAWPRVTSPQETYVMTGEPFVDGAFPAALAGVSPEAYLLAYVPGIGNVYFIGPQLVAQAARHAPGRRLLYLAFPYAWKGSWQERLAGAASHTAIGADWRIDPVRNAAWTHLFYREMLDTRPNAPPLSVAEWFARTDVTFVDSTETYPPHRIVTLRYAGDGSTRMRDDLRLREIVPSVGTSGTVVELRGWGFGESAQGSEVWFGGERIGDIVDWSDRAVRFRVPDRPGVHDAHLVVMGQATERVSFELVEPILAQVTSATRVRWSLGGVHTFRYTNTDELVTGFEVLVASTIVDDAHTPYHVVPLEWSGPSFSADFYREQPATGELCAGVWIRSLSGTLGPDGLHLEVLDGRHADIHRCTGPTDDHTTGSEMRLTDLSYSPSASSDTLIVYTIDGAVGEPHAAVEFTETDRPAIWEDRVYVGTDWFAEGEWRPEIRVAFTIPPVGEREAR